jgi:hypothetical protein
MKLSPSWPTASWAETQELSNILWNPKVYYRVQNSPPLVPILWQINPVHTTLSYLSRSILILPPTYVLVLLVVSFLLEFLFSPICATCPAHLVILNLIILIILGEVYMLWSYAVSSNLLSLHPLRPNTFLSNLCSNTLSLCSSLNARGKVSHPYRIIDKIIVSYIIIFTCLDSRREDKRFWTER